MPVSVFGQKKISIANALYNNKYKKGLNTVCNWIIDKFDNICAKILLCKYKKGSK